MDDNLGSFSALPQEIRRLILQEWIYVEFVLRTETTSRSWAKMCWDAVEEINIQSPVSGTGKIFNNAPLDRVRKINVNLSLRGISLFKNFDYIPKLASLKQLSFGGIDGATEPKVRETVKFMTWIQALQLRYTKKIQPKVFDLLSRHTSLKKIVLGHASSLATIEGIEVLTNLTTLKLPFCSSLQDSELLRVILHLTKLVKLDLTWLKKITADSFTHITKLTNLTLLDISNCSMLSEHALSALVPLNQRLAHLDLSFYHNLTDEGLLHIAKMTNLTRMVMTEQTFTDAGLGRLSALINLRDLTISIGAHSCDFLRTMTKLKRLSVNSVTDALPPLPNLDILKVKSSTVKGALRDSLTNFVNLKSLHLFYTGVGKKAMKIVSTYSQLQSLYMYGTSIEACEYIAHCTTLNIIEFNCRRNWSMLSSLTNLDLICFTVETEEDDFVEEDFVGFARLSRLSSIHLRVRNQAQKDALLVQLSKLTPRRNVRITLTT